MLTGEARDELTALKVYAPKLTYNPNRNPNPTPNEALTLTSLYFKS